MARRLLNRRSLDHNDRCLLLRQHAGASQAQGAIKDKNAMAQAIRDEASRDGTAQAVLATMAEPGVTKKP